MYRILGRDPGTRPLVPLELALFERALSWLLEKEFSSPQSQADD